MINETVAISTAIKVEAQELIEALTKLIVSQPRPEGEGQALTKMHLDSALRCMEEAINQLENVIDIESK